MKILDICPNCSENMCEDEISETECFNCSTSLIDNDNDNDLTNDGDNLQQSLVRSELTLKILKAIGSFQSEAEPGYKKLTKDDIVFVLSSIISRKTS